MKLCFKAISALLLVTLVTGSVAQDSSADFSKSGQRVVYIAVRQDGVFGTGRESDPYDGSTPEKFDFIMDRLPLNATVSLSPGSTFWTNGLKWPDNSKGWIVKNGLHILGNDATIKLASYPRTWTAVPGQKHVVIGNRYYDRPANNVVIENLTIDANWQGLKCQWKNKAVMCAFVYGSNNTYRAVHAINAYGDSVSGTECFILCFNAAPGGAVDCWAYNCTIDKPQGDYQAGIGFFGYNQAQPMRQSGATECSALARCESGLISLAYDDGLTVSRCYSYDSQGVHHDTGTLRHLVVKNCIFQRIFTTGVQSMASSADASDLIVTDNYFQITNQNPKGHTYGVTADATNTVITNNIFDKDASGDGYRGWRAIFSTHANGMIIKDNIGDGSMEYWVGGAHIEAQNNRDFKGRELPFLQTR